MLFSSWDIVLYFNRFLHTQFFVSLFVCCVFLLLRDFLDTDRAFNCNYTAPEGINSFCSNYGGNFGISFLHVYIRSLNRNFESLSQLLKLSKHTFSLIAVSETWLNEVSNIELFNIPDYNLVHRNRPEGIEGGVALCINKQLNVFFV